MNRQEKLDRSVFIAGMKQLETLWGKISTDKMDIYYNAFKNLGNREFASACDRVIACRIYPTFPLPAEIITANMENKIEMSKKFKLKPEDC